jgi:hypothetical protein
VSLACGEVRFRPAAASGNDDVAVAGSQPPRPDLALWPWEPDPKSVTAGVVRDDAVDVQAAAARIRWIPGLDRGEMSVVFAACAQSFREPVRIPATARLLGIWAAWDYEVQVSSVKRFRVKLMLWPREDLDFVDLRNHQVRRTFAIVSTAHETSPGAPCRQLFSFRGAIAYCRGQLRESVCQSNERHREYSGTESPVYGTRD